MLKEFYDFIAKEINRYFQAISSQGILQESESFCLKLDNDEMVEKVTDSLKSLAKENNILGEYTKCNDNKKENEYMASLYFIDETENIDIVNNKTQITVVNSEKMYGLFRRVLFKHKIKENEEKSVK